MAIKTGEGSEAGKHKKAFRAAYRMPFYTMRLSAE